LGLRAEDNGKGMTADEINRVLDPFFTTKGVDEGTGLGLSIVRRLIGRAGGLIAIHSGKGQGTRVEIAFANISRA
jgi:signal transduction histidine kinase